MEERVTTESEGWTLRVTRDPEAMSRLAADLVAEMVREKPNATITLPTGSTPLGMFADLVRRVERGELDLSRVHVFCLDEYLGVAPDEPNSLTGWLQREFLGPAKIDPARIYTMPAADPDPVAAAARYEAVLAARGGFDLAVLGLGPNGHIAYNEPGSAANSRTRVIDLAPDSIAQASGYWRGSQPNPRQAMTIGVANLLEARRIGLIVAGAGKADVLRRALEEPMSAEVPASWLRSAGERLTVIADEAAASRLSSRPAAP
jgi:glucosamine-6-phosphate deaminase